MYACVRARARVCGDFFGKFVISLRRIKCWCFKDKYYFWPTHQLHCSECPWLPMSVHDKSVSACTTAPTADGCVAKRDRRCCLTHIRSLGLTQHSQTSRSPPLCFPWKVKAARLNHRQTRDCKCRFGPRKSNLRRSAVYIYWCHNRDESQQCFSPVLL